MSAVRFQRLIRDAGLLDARLSAADVDLLYQSVAQRSSACSDHTGPAMGFHEYCDALLAIAIRRYDSTFGPLAGTLERIIQALPSGPSSTSAAPPLVGHFALAKPLPVVKDARQSRELSAEPEQFGHDEQTNA